MKEIKLAHGHVLKITPAPFSDAKALFQALVAEGKELAISGEDEKAKLYKDIFCAAFASERLDHALSVCMVRCLYNDMKIDEDTFEEEKSRENYIQVCVEVAQVNLAPFTKGLSAALPRLIQTLENIQA